MKLFQILQDSPAWVLSIIGAGGSGKTTKAWFLIDKIFTGDQVFCYGYPSGMLLKLPVHLRRRVHVFNEWSEIAGRPGIVFLDDMAIHFLSRSSSSGPSKDFISMLTIGRHNGHRYIITSQNSILSDKGLFESLDQYALRCRMTYTQTMTEREEYVNLQLQINDILEEISEDTRGLCYCPETEEIYRFPNWEYMTDEISKPYAGAYVKDGKVVFAGQEVASDE